MGKASATVDSCRHKTGFVATLSRVFSKPDYDKYTIEELHAEVCYTEVLNMRACLGFIEDESLMGMVKSALKIRSCNSIYKYVWSVTA
jgi:hypothetical protein